MCVRIIRADEQSNQLFHQARGLLVTSNTYIVQASPSGCGWLEIPGCHMLKKRERTHNTGAPVHTGPIPNLLVSGLCSCGCCIAAVLHWWYRISEEVWARIVLAATSKTYGVMKIRSSKQGGVTSMFTKSLCVLTHSHGKTVLCNTFGVISSIIRGYPSLSHGG